MNDTERDRIAAAINQLRPDWPTTSLRSLLARPELVQRPRRDVAVALAWVACDAATRTPARVIEPGPWWRAVTVEHPEQAPRPPRPTEACDTCGRHERSCICDEPTPDRPRGWASEHPVGPTPTWRETRAALRAQRHHDQASDQPDTEETTDA